MKLNSVLVAASKSLKLFKILKAAKLIKPALSFLSMACFAACYSTALGIWLAIALVALLFIHELGHIIVLRKFGYGLKMPMFIPFVGAVIAAPSFHSRHKEAAVGFGGPFLGTIAAIAFAIPALFTEHKVFWLTGALIGLSLNLFNMIPISPLDGGRITQAISRKFKWVGMLVLLIFTIALGEPGMLMIWIVAIHDLDRLSFRQRLRLSSAVWLLMAILTACGVGHNYITNIVDTAISFILVATLWLVARSVDASEIERQERENADRRTDLGVKKRKSWFWKWATLATVQAVGCISIASVIHSITPRKPTEMSIVMQFDHPTTNIIWTNIVWTVQEAK